MKHISVILLAFFTLSCNDSKKVADAKPLVAGSDVLLWSAQKEGITLREIYSIQFPQAHLSMEVPVNGTSVTDDSVSFSYRVENYSLGVMTGDYIEKSCANSAQGQHIHQILNNEPYTAHYNQSFKKNLADGHYVCLSFLSRSYHESIKDKAACQLSQFIVGEGQYEAFDTKAPHMFYSRPKGTYVGMDTEKILLDFYLVNCTLSEKGYNVKATINGTIFLLNKWTPFTIEGLPMGENIIQLELIDAKGQTVVSPYNPVTRKITLKES